MMMIMPMMAMIFIMHGVSEENDDSSFDEGGERHNYDHNDVNECDDVTLGRSGW